MMSHQCIPDLFSKISSAVYFCFQLREDLMEKLKAEPVLQLLFQSWDKIKSNIENEDAYKALSSIDIDYVFRDYDHVCNNR